MLSKRVCANTRLLTFAQPFDTATSTLCLRRESESDELERQDKRLEGIFTGNRPQPTPAQAGDFDGAPPRILTFGLWGPERATESDADSAGPFPAPH